MFTDLATLVMATSKDALPSKVACQGVTLLHKVVEASNKLVEPHLVLMCHQITSLTSRPLDEVFEWTKKLIFGREGHETDSESQAVANMNQLKNFITALVEEDW